jgi:hypothetical protein
MQFVPNDNRKFALKKNKNKNSRSTGCIDRNAFAVLAELPLDQQPINPPHNSLNCAVSGVCCMRTSDIVHAAGRHFKLEGSPRSFGTFLQHHKNDKLGFTSTM